MRFKTWLLTEADNLQVGQIIEIPGQNGRYPLRVQIIKINGDTVWIRQVNHDANPDVNDDMAGGNPFKMTRAAVRHWQNDLTGKVQINAKTDDPYIQKVLAGEGKYLGKGDDGVAFEVGDMIVKASTTVPFQPDSQWQRNPSTAARMIVMNVRLTESLRKQGVPGILPTYFKIVGDKAFMVRPKVDIKETYSKPQIFEVKASIEAIHKAGYAINDEIQVGERDGHMYHYDLGKMAKIAHKDDPKDDMERFKRWASKSGFDDPLEKWEYLVGMLSTWHTEDGVFRRKYLQKIGPQKELMDKEYPERKEKTEREYQAALAGKAVEDS